MESARGAKESKGWLTSLHKPCPYLQAKKMKPYEQLAAKRHDLPQHNVQGESNQVLTLISNYTNIS